MAKAREADDDLVALLEQPARRAAAAVAELDDLAELRALDGVEQAGRRRKTVLAAIAKAIEAAKPPARNDGAPPADIAEDLQAVWLEARDTLKRDERWTLVARALLDQFVRAMNSARIDRQAADDEPFVEGSTGQIVAHPGRKSAEAAEAKAIALAEKLVLTPDARARRGLSDGEPQKDGFDALFG
ncbi:MAG TPA: P27 family phage terminase small subunit [Solirubrobacter sp.]|nr:P27 family phage terminase small subunit [Solirubrobacter sp.]